MLSQHKIRNCIIKKHKVSACARFAEMFILVIVLNFQRAANKAQWFSFILTQVVSWRWQTLECSPARLSGLIIGFLTCTSTCGWVAVTRSDFIQNDAYTHNGKTAIDKYILICIEVCTHSASKGCEHTSIRNRITGILTPCLTKVTCSHTYIKEEWRLPVTFTLSLYSKSWVI